MGNMILAATSPAHKGTNFLPILIIVVLFVLLYVTMIRPQRNRQRRASQMQGGVVPGQRVRTTSGIYGTIVAIQDNDVVVEVAPGVNIRMLRRAVMEVVPDGTADGVVPEPPAADANAADMDSQKP